MSGGVAYVLDVDHALYKNVNKELVSIEEIISKSDKEKLYEILQEHYKETNSAVARHILDHFDDELQHFKKIIPNDYKKMLKSIKDLQDKGYHQEEAELKAFTMAFQK